MIRPLIGKYVNSVLHKIGYELRSINDLQSTPLPLEAAMHRILKIVKGIRTVIDIGASNGCWTQSTMRFFPDAFFLLIEANQHHEAELKNFSRNHNNVDYIISAAGDRVGYINFDKSDPFGGLASDLPIEEFKQHNLQATQPLKSENYIKIPVTTVDNEINRRKCSPPFFLKLDVHGYELPILNGAKEILRDTLLVQIETYNFNLTIDSLRMHETIGYFENQGFRLLDICDPLHRRDGAFWQIDLFFIPKTHAVFSSNTYDGIGNGQRNE